MTLSREEIAVRVLCALAGRDGYGTDTATADAVIYADTLLRNLALTPTPTPVAPPAGKYEPRVGDVVRFKDSTSLWVVDGKRPSNPHFTVGITDTVHWSRGCCNPDELTYVRPSTDAEKRAAGLAVPPPAPTPAPEVCCASPLCPHSSPGGGTSQVGGAAERDAGIVTPASPTPAPEAKRPEWVRVVRSESPHYIKDGQVYRVRGWEGGNPCVEHAAFPDAGFCLCATTWEPAPCPPPVAGSGATLPDNVREFLLDVEYAAKWANQPQGPAIEYVKGRLKELAARAHDILTSPVRP